MPQLNPPPPNLNRLLCPSTIAVFGGQFAEAVINQCDKMGFAGKIYPIHPQRKQIGDRRCYREVSELPSAPDASFIGVNRHETINIVHQLSQAGAGGAVCYASGFEETGDTGLSEQLLAAAADMPVLGPNCYGFINYLDGALLWPDQHGGKRVDSGVAILMQSSNIAINLTMNQRAVPIACLIALGNQTMVGMSDVVTQLCLDDRITAIGLHIEGVDHIQRFAQAIRIAQQHNKPVVVLKTGRSEKGAAITVSHTASLAGNDRVMDAVFSRLGIARVHSISQFLETLKLLHVFGPLPGYDVVSLSCSGGEASMISDSAMTTRLEFRDFTDADIVRLKPTQHQLVNISNPFDYHTFDWADPVRLEATYTAVMESGYTLNLLLMDFPRPDRCKIDDWLLSLSAWQEAAKKTGARCVLLASLPECLPEDVAEQLIGDGIAPLAGIEDALVAIEAAATVIADCHDWQPLDISDAGSIRTLDEYESKQMLENYNIPVPQACLASNFDAAGNFAKIAGFPLVAKAVGNHLEHKTEQGAVRLNLKNHETLETACSDLLQLSGGLLIEKMIQDSELELILGVNRDPVAGLHLLIGAGGVMTELLGDSQILMFPFTREQVSQALGQLRVAALLGGFRGKPKISQDSIITALMKLQELVLDHADAIQEIDINPLIVTTAGEACAVDALVRLAQPSGQTD